MINSPYLAKALDYFDKNTEAAKVRNLEGQAWESTLATNSLKLRFNTDQYDKGNPYIWIDPPWLLMWDEEVAVSAQDYIDADNGQEWFGAWPLRSSKLVSSKYSDGCLVLVFEGGYRLVVPPNKLDVDSDDFYSHWYVSEKS